MDTLSILFQGGGLQKEDAGATNVYVPQEGDHRTFSRRCVADRRGQPKFRDALLRTYHGRCVVTDCAVHEVLEAAHINPHRGPNDDKPENGLLLRADIHTLFDLDLLAIVPDTLRVELAAELAKDKYYKYLADKQLFETFADRPSLIALRMRYDIFKKQQDVV